MENEGILQNIDGQEFVEKIESENILSQVTGGGMVRNALVYGGVFGGVGAITAACEGKDSSQIAVAGASGAVCGAGMSVIVDAAFKGLKR